MVANSERVVMDTLGIDVDATDGDNLSTFKRMNNETGEFTYGEVAVWFRYGFVCMLSKRGKMPGKCQRWAVCAEDYPQRLATDGMMNQGRIKGAGGSTNHRNSGVS